MKKTLIFLAGTTAVSFFLSITLWKLSSASTLGSYPEGIVKSYAKKQQKTWQKVALKREQSPENIEKINVNVRSLSIQIVENDKSLIEVEVHADIAGENPESRFKFSKDGSELNIDFDERDLNFVNSNWFKIHSATSEGTMLIKVPKGVAKINVSTVSGDIKNQMNLSQLEIKTVSGDLSSVNYNVADLRIQTISGSIELSGQVEHLRSESISGDIKAKLMNKAPRAFIKTVSGDANLYFQEKPNAVFDFRSISGEMEFNSHTSETTSFEKKGNFKSGAGDGEVIFQSTSGDLKVE